MAGSGANLSIIGKSLNHKSLDTTKTYDRLWIDPVREAMEKAVWAAAGSVDTDLSFLSFLEL